jgi:phospholipase C
MPAQEPGVRPARALPYALHAMGVVQAADGSVRIDFGNAGKAAAVFHVRSAQPAHDPRSYTVEPGAALSGVWSVAAAGTADYDISVHGPNGFLRRFKGSVAPDRTQLAVQTAYDEQTNRITLTIANRGSYPVSLDVLDNYSGKTVSETLAPGASASRRWSLARVDGWYDYVIAAQYEPGFQYQLAGHLETGKDSISDPAMGGVL